MALRVGVGRSSSRLAAGWHDGSGDGGGRAAAPRPCLMCPTNCAHHCALLSRAAAAAEARNVCSVAAAAGLAQAAHQPQCMRLLAPLRPRCRRQTRRRGGWPAQESAGARLQASSAEQTDPTINNKRPIERSAQVAALACRRRCRQRAAAGARSSITHRWPWLVSACPLPPDVVYKRQGSQYIMLHSKTAQRCYYSEAERWEVLGRDERQCSLLEQKQCNRMHGKWGAHGAAEASN